MLDLNSVVPQPHPTDKIFKRHKIPRKVLRLALGISYSHLCNVLNGTNNPSEDLDSRLRQVAAQLEQLSQVEEGQDGQV